MLRMFTQKHFQYAVCHVMKYASLA